MSSASIVLLPRLAGVDQRSGERGGTDTYAGGGFPAKAAFVLSRFLTRLGTFYLSHGFIVGRGVIIFAHAAKMNQRDAKVNRLKSLKLSRKLTARKSLTW
jgi:hypothetical protein